MPKPVLAVLIAAGFLAAYGAAFASPRMLGTGWAVALAVLVLRLVLARPAPPQGPRLLLLAGLLFLTIPVLLQVRAMVTATSASRQPAVVGILAV